MQKITGSKAAEMLNEQRRKIASLKPGDVGFGLHFHIPEFNPDYDTLIIRDDGTWAVDHGIVKAAEHPLERTGLSYCDCDDTEVSELDDTCVVCGLPKTPCRSV